MIGQQFNGSHISDSSFVINQFYRLTKEQAKQELAEYDNEQLKKVLGVLFKERWRVFLSPFTMPRVWLLFASIPLFLCCIHYSPLFFNLLGSDVIAATASILLVAGGIFAVFALLWHYLMRKIKFDLGAIDQLLRQNWQMKRWIDEEIQSRKYQHWKSKCGVKGNLGEYFE